jgi:hypothetical protein
MNQNADAGLSLIESFRHTLDEQVRKVLARRIHAKVRDARSDPDIAARRWPFELIQNAHDAGTRDGRDGISVIFEFTAGVLRFKHDATPFGMTDIAALLTGGSSKDFDSTETTGRFGTGFLVTHALSQRVHVAGILEVNGECRTFNVTLDRPADEDLILQNITDSEAALGQTRAVTDLDSSPTATLEYVVDDETTALAGLSMLEHALPYLFASCRRLREITIQRESARTCWRSHPATRVLTREGLHLEEVLVNSYNQDDHEDVWRVLRAGTTPQAEGWLLIALCRHGESWELSKPSHVPSVFRQLPVIGGPTIPTWAILDGEFELDQERSTVHVVGEQGEPVREALAALGALAELAIQEGWKNGFRIAQLGMPAEGLGEAAMAFWRDSLSNAANTLSRLPLVSTARHGMLPAVHTDEHDRYADFIARGSTGSEHSELWTLASECAENDPPVLSDSEGWSEIVQGWEDLGLSFEWVDLKLIGGRASSQATLITELPVDVEPHTWLARYLDAVGRAWQAGGVTKDHVAKLLPDQHGKLRSAGELRRDNAISERVKEIADDVGLGLRSLLLDDVLIQVLTRDNLEAGLAAIAESTGSELGEEEAVHKVVQHVTAALPTDQLIGEEKRKAAAASLALLAHLWESQGTSAANIAWEVPLLAADGTARKAALRRQMVLPVAAWPEAARPFAKAYPASRLLADDYAAANGGDQLLEALPAWGIAHRGLLVTGQREELRDRGLRAIASGLEEVEGAKLRDVEMTQIALLEPEVINFARQDRERSIALLGLVVRYVAPEDESWRSEVKMVVRATSGDMEVSLTPSLWLADLRSKPWIPVETGDDITYHVPNPELLRELVDPQWLEGNHYGADLLVRHFDMDALDVRLLAAAKDEGMRQRMRDNLARIVELAGGNPQVLEELVAKAEQQRRDIDRMRNLGLAVQESVKMAIERSGLEARLIDRGYDYLVSAVSVREESPEDLSANFEICEFKVEVKTTTTDEARLTPLQALTVVSDPGSYVLCVVDLRSYQGDVHQVDWAVTDVAPLCRMISARDLPINQTLTLVQNAEGSDVPIRNATALRYAIRPSLWASGVDLDQWVQTAFGQQG